jgi:prepilin-type processing-associated H-X9-DG protein
LAAILFPVFARAREKARQTSCLSNVKQISTAMQMYVSDYDEVFPLAYFESTPRTSIIQVVHPYVQNEQVWNCPSADLASRVVWAGDRSYGWNWLIMHIWGATKLAEIEAPAERVVCGDFTMESWTPSALLQPSRGHRPDPVDGSRYNSYVDHNVWGDYYFNFCARHNLTGNVCFVDGHSKAMSYSALYDGGKNTYFGKNGSDYY